ncbi:MAG: hypothetical protein KAS21_07820 [Candidatus Aminicenantes bacterium]|nr:hypothetical protein [Candidatus Aminicenantes bacterium]MCK5004980.1 hypothetical protein [Candidatus Aminicenantes bacterium]
MNIIEVLNGFEKEKFSPVPGIVYSSLYKKVRNNFYYEFEDESEQFLFSPHYVPLRGRMGKKMKEFIESNEILLNEIKDFILNSLFVYSALIDENSYYLSNSQSIFIARLIHKRNLRFEVKFYAHYQDELENSYKDKIYIGRDFINLYKFERKYLGLKKYYKSLEEQNEKIQERAKHKLRYYDDYKKNFMDEIDYLVNDVVNESMGRIQFFQETKMSDIPSGDLLAVLDHILYLLNLMIELRDFSEEFENKLRLREENDFVKYLTKFSKDLIDGIRYLRKLTFQLHLKISKYQI